MATSKSTQAAPAASVTLSAYADYNQVEPQFRTPPVTSATSFARQVLDITRGAQTIVDLLAWDRDLEEAVLMSDPQDLPGQRQPVMGRYHSGSLETMLSTVLGMLGDRAEAEIELFDDRGQP